MEAPDKIYLPRDIDLPSAAILTLGKQPGDVEYIRKDALLEWLEEQLSASYRSMDFRSNLAYSKVVDKIKSL